MSIVQLLPGEKLLGSARSYGLRTTFYATDKRLVRSDWSLFGSRTQGLSYDQIKLSIQNSPPLSFVILGSILLAVDFLGNHAPTFAWNCEFIGSLASCTGVSLYTVIPFFPYYFPVGLSLLIVGALWAKPVFQVEVSGLSGGEDRWKIPANSAGKRLLTNLVGIQLVEIRISNGVTKSSGPELPTFFERVVSALPVRYGWGCLVLGVIAGGPFIILATLPEIGSPSVDFASRTFSFAPPTFSLWLEYALVGTLSAIQLLVIGLTIRYMRMKVVSADSQFSKLSSEETFHRAFQRLTRSRPPVLLGILFVVGILSIEQTLQPFVGFQSAEIGFVTLFGKFDFQGPSNWHTAVLWGLGFGTFVWVYFASILGLHNLGKADVKLTRYTEDKLLGVRIFGSLSLGLALGYFSALSSIAIGLIALGLTSSFPLVDLAILLALLVAGILVFLIPLRSIHLKMRKEKRVELESIRDQKRKVLSDTSKDANEALREVKRLENEEQEVNAIATWPIDVGIIGRFATMVSSVTLLVLPIVLGLIDPLKGVVNFGSVAASVIAVSITTFVWKGLLHV